jgi:hypothetical protein
VANVHIVKLEKSGAYVRKTSCDDGKILLQYTFFDDELIGKTIIVLKEIMLLQETESSYGERTFTKPKTQLVIFRVDKNNNYIYAKNEIANQKDFEIVGDYRYPINKRKFIIGFNELIDLITRKLVKIN